MPWSLGTNTNGTNLKIGNFAFSDRHCSPGIQVADMLAYLLFDYHRRCLADAKAQAHPYLTGLMTRKNQVIGRLIDKKEEVERWAKILEQFGSIPRQMLKGFNP